MATTRIDSKSVDRLNSILKRKDVIEIDNQKADTVRMLTAYFEKSISIKQLTDYLKK